MVFSSLTFIYFFFAAAFAAYFVLPGLKAKNAVLLIVSLVFYSWGEPKYVVLMIITTLIAYLGGLLISGSKGGQKRFVYICTCVLILLGLVIFKYLDFVLNAFGKEGPGLSLPIGISFYTFQVLSYVIDLKRGEVELQKNYFKLLLYVSLFPHLISGPIVRYSTVAGEIDNRKHSINDMAAGFRRFTLGLAKKCILANGVAKIAEEIYAGEVELYGSLMYWLAAICYALQIYYDFSGYSDMAIGLGRVLGFHFEENFNQPYLASSVTDFWRRWHISLSSWFRDYVYIPLGGNRVSIGRWMLNILAVWGLTGLWHGASWNFVIWGLYYALLLMIEKFFLGKLLKKAKVINHFYTLFAVVIGWVIFNFTDFTRMFKVLGIMFKGVPCNVFDVIASNSQLSLGIIFVPLAIICLFAKPFVEFLEKKEALGNIISLVLFVVCTVFILSTSYNPFIYFRF